MITKILQPSTSVVHIGAKRPQSARGRFETPRAEQGRMPRELASTILRHSVGAFTHGGVHCHRCGRTPLVGELMHVLESERMVCQLCVPRLRARDGEPVRSE